MNEKPFAPATERNKEAILSILRYEFRNAKTVLEIGSGTGQHAVFFGGELDYLDWQTSDVAENHAGITAWIQESGLVNVAEPLDINVLTSASLSQYDCLFSANTAHIMSFAAVEKMFHLAAATIPEGGVFVLYGPFRRNGKFNAPSNASFDRSLRDQDAEMGIRDLEDLDRLARDGRMWRRGLYAMPANNYIAVWEKSGSELSG